MVRLTLSLAVAVLFVLAVPVAAQAHDQRYDGTTSGDVAEGHAHYDAMFGYQGDDTLYGWDDQDYLLGGEGDDELFGGQGADIIEGGKGTDVLWGGKGNDFLRDMSGEPGIAQVFKCGDGYDWFAVPVDWQSGVHYLAFGCEERGSIIPDPPPRR